MTVTIYTDGGSDPNPGIGGWAAILQYGEHEKVLTGNDPDTTNNRMELSAAINALQALNRRTEIEMYVDSEYVRRGITEWIDGWAKRDWKRKGGSPVPNADLWKTLWALSIPTPSPPPTTWLMSCRSRAAAQMPSPYAAANSPGPASRTIGCGTIAASWCCASGMASSPGGFGPPPWPSGMGPACAGAR